MPVHCGGVRHPAPAGATETLTEATATPDDAVERPSLRREALRSLGVWLALASLTICSMTGAALTAKRGQLVGREGEAIAHALQNSLELRVAATNGDVAGARRQIEWVEGFAHSLHSVVILLPSGAELVRIGQAEDAADGWFVRTTEVDIRPDRPPTGAADADPAAIGVRPRVRVTMTALPIARFLALLLLVVAAALSTVAIFVTLKFVANVAAWLAPTLQQAQRLRAGDLTARADAHFEELQVLADAFNDVSSSLEHMISGVRGHADGVANAVSVIRAEAIGMREDPEVQARVVAAAEDSVNRLLDGVEETKDRIGGLSESLDRSSQGTERIASTNSGSSDALQALLSEVQRQQECARVLATAADGLLESARELGKGSESARAAATRIANSLEASTARASESAALTKQALEESVSGGEAISATVARVGDITAQTLRLDKVFASFLESVEEVRPLLLQIQEVTDSTRLLALNAGILAAQAGEAGRPFQVVVQELNKLGRQTVALTVTAGDALASVVAGRETVTEELASLRSVVNSSTADAARAGGALERIRESAAGSERVAEQIRGVVQEQHADVDEALRLLDSLCSNGKKVDNAASSLDA
jgi:methyl-accepting chemotaxis protein